MNRAQYFLHKFKYNLSEDLVKFKGSDIEKIDGEGYLILKSSVMERLGYAEPFIQFKGQLRDLKRFEHLLRSSNEVEFDPLGDEGFVIKTSDTDLSSNVQWHDDIKHNAVE